jgi:DNA-binding beta-propeller fold protein YncE
MQLIGDKIYVACSGGFASDSSVYVINTITDAVDQILKVGANPNYIIKTDNQTLFVLCSGRWTSDYKSLEAYGSLVKINTADNSFTKLFELSDLNNSQPNSLTSNGSNLYFNFGGTVYQQSITGSTFENNSFITRNFYGLGVDPISNKLYAADAGNFSNAGKVLRYDLTGNVIDSFNVAVAPNGFYFNTK